MTVGIIGAGQLAQAFAIRAVAAGIDVALSNSRGPRSLAALVEQLGPHARAVTRFEAAQEDTVLLAVPADQVALALSGLTWAGQTLVDPTNLMPAPALQPGELSTSAFVQELARGAHVVKSLNTISAHILSEPPEQEGGRRRLLFLCGDDGPSKEAFRLLLERMGFATVDLGSLIEGSRLQQVPGGALANLNLIRIR